MYRSICVAAGIALSLAAATGCQQAGTPEVKNLEVIEQDPLVEAKALLQRYVEGNPVTSEAEGFANLAQRVKEKDAAKGELLDKGLAEIKANPASAKNKATELLKNL
jgi:hypothetical protein